MSTPAVNGGWSVRKILNTIIQYMNTIRRILKFAVQTKCDTLKQTNLFKYYQTCKNIK